MRVESITLEAWENGEKIDSVTFVNLSDANDIEAGFRADFQGCEIYKRVF